MSIDPDKSNNFCRRSFASVSPLSLSLSSRFVRNELLSSGNAAAFWISRSDLSTKLRYQVASCRTSGIGKTSEISIATEAGRRTHWNNVRRYRKRKRTYGEREKERERERVVWLTSRLIAFRLAGSVNATTLYCERSWKYSSRILGALPNELRRVTK